MKEPARQLHYREEDRRLLAPAELSQRARISLGLIRLCIDTGCPTTEGKLSQADLLDWLFQNFAAVRATAGFPAFAPLDGLDPELTARLMMANAILTILEYGESRSSNPDEKEQLRWIRKTIEISLDRA